MMMQDVNVTQNSVDGGNSGGAEESSFQELKTPTGQPSGHYITPTSVNLVTAKKLSQNTVAGLQNASSRVGNQMNMGGAEDGL